MKTLWSLAAKLTVLALAMLLVLFALTTRGRA